MRVLLSVLSPRIGSHTSLDVSQTAFFIFKVQNLIPQIESSLYGRSLGGYLMLYDR